MKIGILGTRGIPNNYGGFEECAEHLGVLLVSMGHQVWVYNSHRHPFNQKNYQGVEIIHKYDPEHRMGTAGQFIYDLNCIIDSRKRGFDVILLLGYTSSSIWQRLIPKKPVIVSNMDGLEWKRSKYRPQVRKYLEYAEKWAAKGSDILIADSQVIQEYLERKYAVDSVHIAYGADLSSKNEPQVLEAYNLEPEAYHLLIARLERENNIELILDGALRSESSHPFLVVGNHETAYGNFLKNKYKDSRIRFVQGIYEKDKLNSLRHNARLYFHGHSVGGTNPSLLEAMASKVFIVAHNNKFNREVLGEDAAYFNDPSDVANHLDHWEKTTAAREQIASNYRKVKEKYQWSLIAEKYEITFQQALIRKRK